MKYTRRGFIAASGIALLGGCMGPPDKSDYDYYVNHEVEHINGRVVVDVEGVVIANYKASPVVMEIILYDGSDKITSGITGVDITRTRYQYDFKVTFFLEEIPVLLRSKAGVKEVLNDGSPG